MRIFFGIIAILSLGACITLAVILNNEHQATSDIAFNAAQHDATEAVASIENHLIDLQVLTDEAAKELSADRHSRIVIEAMLQKFFLNNSIYSASVVFTAEPVENTIKYYATRSHSSRDDRNTLDITQEPFQPEINDKHQSLQQIMIDKKGKWQNPQYSRDSAVLVCGYSSPILLDGNVIGAISLTYDIKELHRIMRDVHIWNAGFGIIFDQHGHLIYHPNSELIISNCTSSDDNTQYAQKYPILYQLSQLKPNQKDNTIQLKDASGRAAWSIQKHIQETHWRMSLVFYKDEILFESNTQGLILRWLTICSVIGSLSLFLSLILHIGIRKRTLWWISYGFTTVFLAGSLVIWYQSLASRSNDDNVQGKIKNQSDIKDFIQNTRDRSQKLRLEDPMFIPTGTLIRSVNFTSATDVVVNGYIWQHYNLSDIKGENPILPQQGVTFVEAFEDDINLTALESDYTSVENGVKTFVWYFKITLRQKFSYEQFPFDHEAVWVRLRYLDAKRNVILIPDLNAYNLVYESACPGIDPNDFILPGWSLEGSYFTFQNGNDNANFFDFRHAAALGNTPEFMFNISIKRNFVDPFVANITPLIIIFTILYIIIMTSTRDESQAARYGFSSFPAVALIAALLFSMMYLHTSLRANLSSSSITYFECFYILGYFMMILVAINSAILTSESKNRFVWHPKYGNLFPQISYWPLASAVLFLVTAWKLQF